MVILSRFFIHGDSMAPTILPGAWVLVSSIPYLFSQPKVCDVVVVQDPRDRKYLVKRITARKKNGYFVTGDNKARSTDSRHFGFLKKHAIIGKVMYALTSPKHD